jgi:hypothetical protein
MEPIDAPDSPYAPKAFAEGPLEGNMPAADPDDLYEDDWSLMAGALERQTEALILPPPEVWEPVLFGVAPVGPPPLGYVSPGPPQAREPERLSWVAMEAPLGARPYFTRDGLPSPAHQSRGGGGAGRYSPGLSPSMRFCPWHQQWIDQDACVSCERHRDDDGSGPTCEYDKDEDADNEQ